MAGEEGGPVSPSTNRAHCTGVVARLPAVPLPSSSKWGNLRGQLISQGLLIIFITPHTLKKKSSCHVAVTSCPTVVPGMFVVGCHGDGRSGTTLVLVGRELPLPLGPQLGGHLGDQPRGPFQTECVWSLMSQIPQGPQTSVCG